MAFPLFAVLPAVMEKGEALLGGQLHRLARDLFLVPRDAFVPCRGASREPCQPSSFLWVRRTRFGHGLARVAGDI